MQVRPLNDPIVEEAFPVLEVTEKADDSPKDIMATLPNKKRLTTLSIMVCDTILEVQSCTILKVLFDPGSMVTFISCKCLPRCCKHCPIMKRHSVTTLAGSCMANNMVVLQQYDCQNWTRIESSTSTKCSCLMATFVTT